MIDGLVQDNMPFTLFILQIIKTIKKAQLNKFEGKNELYTLGS